MAKRPRLLPVPAKNRFSQKLIASRIKSARADAGFNAKEMAAKAGIEQWSYYKKESGDAPFRLEEIERVCDQLPRCPSLFPFLDWDAAVLADRLLGRGNAGRDR